MTNKVFNWKNVKRIVCVGLASITLLGGVNFYKCATYKNVEIPKENLSETYAILANCSGTKELNRFSKQNHHYSMLNILSAYNLFKQEGLSDENISLLIYNPTSENSEDVKNIFETKEYKSLLERKALTGILPSKTDKFAIDGEATRENFMNALRKLNLDSNDTLYIVLSNPSPKEIDELKTVQYSTANSYFALDDEEIHSGEFASAMKAPRLEGVKKMLILNSGDSNGLLPHLDENIFLKSILLSDKEKKDMGLKNLIAISSPEGWKFDKETFIMNFLNQYKKNKEQSIKELAEKTDGVVYSYDGREVSPEKNPWFNAPLFKN